MNLILMTIGFFVAIFSVVILGCFLVIYFKSKK
jgi:hypothetical protein